MRATRSAGLCLLAMTAATSSLAQTTAPDTPTLTAGAIVKGLQFDWEPVAGASWYQLEYQAHEKAAFVQHGYDVDASVTITHYRFPLHLYDWTGARYRLAACNTAGCTRSAEEATSLQAMSRGLSPRHGPRGHGVGIDRSLCDHGCPARGGGRKWPRPGCRSVAAGAHARDHGTGRDGLCSDGARGRPDPENCVTSWCVSMQGWPLGGDVRLHWQ